MTPQELQKMMIFRKIGNSELDLSSAKPETLKGVLEYLSDNEGNLQQHIDQDTFKDLKTGVKNITNMLPKIARVHKALKNKGEIKEKELAEIMKSMQG